VLGGLLVSRQTANDERLFMLVCIAIALAALHLLSLQWFQGVVGLAVWVACLSVATTVAGTGAQTLIQLSAEGVYRGRVMSVWTMLAMGVPALGAALLGAGVDRFGFTGVLPVAGLLGLCLVGASHAKRATVVSGAKP
jgi:MFS family permease